jgi:coniferyl-aldehyde dehydrogenase
MADAAAPSLKPAHAPDAGAKAGDLLARQRMAHRRDGTPGAGVRRERLQRLEKLVTGYADRFAAAISQDFGYRSPTETAILELNSTLSAIRHARRHVAGWMRPQRRATGFNFLPGRSRVRYEPLGVVGIVSPWNYPLLLAVSPLVDAIAAGNRAIIKPSEATPAFSALLQHAIAEHFAQEEVAVVLGGPDVGAAFTSLSFDHLLFTGSTNVGRKVAQAAADGLVPLTLELGGKSPAIVCPSASLDKAAEAIAWGKFVNAGQTCIAPDYVLAPRALIADLGEAIIANARELYPSLGDDYATIVGDRAYARLTTMLEEAAAAGVTVLAHGAPADARCRRLPPAVVRAPPAGNQMMREEIFGPILPVLPYDDLDEALAFVAGHPHPLALYCFARSAAEIERVLSRTQSGGVTINGTLLHIAQEDLPFGGIGASGMGAYHGRAGFERMSHARAVFRVGAINFASLLYPPYTNLTKRILKLIS